MASIGAEMCCFKRAEGRPPHAGGAQSRGAPPPRTRVLGRRCTRDSDEQPKERETGPDAGSTTSYDLIRTSVDANSSAMLLPPKKRIAWLSAGTRPAEARHVSCSGRATMRDAALRLGVSEVDPRHAYKQCEDSNTFTPPDSRIGRSS